MSILDYFFSNRVDKINFYPRDFKFPSESKVLLYGPRGSGKSYLIFHLLKSIRERYLYIDCQDPIFILEELSLAEVESFIKEEKIELLILDHYFDGFFNKMPDVKRLIVVSRVKLNLPLSEFRLCPLSFNEFLSFKNSNSLESAFSSFIKRGTLPAIAKEGRVKFKDIFFEKFETQEGKVLIILALFNGKVVSIYQLFLKAKEYFKISKDWFYKAIKNFIDEEIIYHIETLNGGFGKKLFIYDFAFSRYLNKYQNFLTVFDSMVALTLIREGFNIKAISNPVGYLVNDTEVVAISPFESQESFILKRKRFNSIVSRLNLSQIEVVTISNEYRVEIDGVTFIATPFYKWIELLKGKS